METPKKNIYFKRFYHILEYFDFFLKLTQVELFLAQEYLKGNLLFVFLRIFAEIAKNLFSVLGKITKGKLILELELILPKHFLLV